MDDIVGWSCKGLCASPLLVVKGLVGSCGCVCVCVWVCLTLVLRVGLAEPQGQADHVSRQCLAPGVRPSLQLESVPLREFRPGTPCGMDTCVVPVCILSYELCVVLVSRGVGVILIGSRDETLPGRR